MTGSADPFGILATVIPILWLLLFIGARLTPWNRLQAWLMYGLAWVLFYGEMSALYGLAFGGSHWMLVTGTMAAMLGAGGCLLVSFDRLQNLTKRNLARLAEPDDSTGA